MFQLPNDSLFEQLPSPLPSRLTSLYLDGTKVKCLPFLPNTLTALYTSNVTCLPNLPPSVWDLGVKIGGFYLNPSQIPICNRNSNCIYPAYISGSLTVDSILNKAAIYFDFNKPIITNTTRTLFNPRVATVELKNLGLNIFPNPVSNILTISSTHKNEQELTIDVVNTNGQVLMRQILRGQNPQINVQELAAGLYFLKIKTAEGIGIVKIVKE